MENKKIIYKGGSSSFTLFVVFLVLKLTNTINWSWVIVTLPLWIGLAMALVFLILALIISILAGIITGLINSFRK